MNATTTAFAVEDMHCSACTSRIERALKRITGVTSLQFNPVRRHVVVEHAADLPAVKLIQGIEEAGFHPALLGNSQSRDTDEQRTLLKRLGVAGLAMMQVMMVQIALYAGAFQGMADHYARILEFTALLFCIPVVSYSAMPFFVSAAGSVRHGLSMDVPIALAITIAFSASLYATLTGVGEVYYDSVVMFTFLLLGARYLEQRLRTRLIVEDALLASLPRTVQKVTHAGRTTVALEALAPGDRVWVDQGEQLPADGVLDGAATVEESMLTGESDWAEKRAQAPVYAGTWNRGPGMTYVVSAVGQDARIGQIDRLAEAALSEKHGLARLADRVARYFIPTILALAATTYLIWWNIEPGSALPAMLAVLVVSCPCALALATPAAITAASARLRQAGVLIKNSAALERAKNVSRLFVDKTGTLTLPAFSITDQRTEPGFEASECLEIARALQSHAAHPIASAFANEDANCSAEDVEVETHGVKGVVDQRLCRIGSAEFAGFPTTKSTAKQVHLSIDGQPAATFTVSAPLRADARDTVRELQTLGMDVEMLSGDTEAHCADIAGQLNIRYQAALSPEEKNQAVEGARGAMFLGDGINDIPAISRAGLSMSTLETNDLVKSKADVVLLTPRLLALVDVVRVARSTSSVLKQNLFWALAYNATAIPLAALGYAPPWVAALGMSASSVLVMLNASRLLRVPLARRNR